MDSLTYKYPLKREEIRTIRKFEKNQRLNMNSSVENTNVFWFDR